MHVHTIIKICAMQIVSMVADCIHGN